MATSICSAGMRQQRHERTCESTLAQLAWPASITTPLSYVQVSTHNCGNTRNHARRSALLTVAKLYGLPAE